MLTARFVDHSEEIIDLLNRKLLAAVGSAAQILSDGYQTGLQATIAPPHSEMGQIPHAYLGHKPGGFGPVNEWGQPNNTPVQGFASTQTQYLSDYIDHGANEVSGEIKGVVGFRPGHVNARNDNYLLWHDTHGRPWVSRLYERNRESMKTAAIAAFEETK